MDDLACLLEQADVRRLRELIEDREDAILLLADLEGRLLWGSADGSRTLFGRSPEQYVGTSASEYLHPDDVAEVEIALREVARTNENREITYRASDDAGGWVTARSVLWPITASDGEQVVVSVTVAAG